MSIKIVETLENVIKSHSDIISILVLDKDGVPVVGAGDEIRNRGTLSSCFTSSMEQVKKLGIGAQKVWIFHYESQQLILLNVDPLAIFILAKTDANTGALCNLGAQLKPVLTECEQIVKNIVLLN